MDPQEFIDHLIGGEYVLVEDYYYNGLQILKELKKSLKRKYNQENFKEQRRFRAAYREASHRLLLMVIDHSLVVRKSPDIGWLKILYPEYPDFLIAFPEIQGLNSSWQWYQNGLKIDILDLIIHPYYGVYFPTRFDHLELFDRWLKTYRGDRGHAIDIGVGSGVLAFQLLEHGFLQVMGTDINKNAIIGTSQEIERLGLSDRLTLRHGDLFADCAWKADLIVFNPPWLTAQHELEKGIDKAIYYEDDLFPRFFEQAKQYLKEEGKMVVLFSNLGQVVGTNNVHPIHYELRTNDRFQQEKYLQQGVGPASKKTKRKNWRIDEKVELWVLSHSNSHKNLH